MPAAKIGGKEELHIAVEDFDNPAVYPLNAVPEEAGQCIAVAYSVSLLDIPGDTLWYHALVPTLRAIQAGHKAAYDMSRSAGRSAKIRDWMTRQNFPERACCNSIIWQLEPVFS